MCVPQSGARPSRWWLARRLADNFVAAGFDVVVIGAEPAAASLRASASLGLGETSVRLKPV